MSQYFDLGDETLWNPSLATSRLFLRQVAVFEAELGRPSGIGEMHSDECQIDPTAFTAFVNALLTWRHHTSHPITTTLTDGFLTTTLALANRAHLTLTWPPTDHATWATPLRHASHALARHMPH